MSDLNLRCVSLANGALSPDLRVNYEFGLVLGVDEFRQEQLYLLEKNYHHDRALHGFGTVYGMEVTATRPPANENDVLVGLGTGMGIDQWGRPIVVRADQCAYLGAWLAKQEQQTPGAIAERLRPDGFLSIYVVAAFDECPEALVPIPGQPCSSSETTKAPSRIRDAHNIELRSAPPDMLAWDAVRRFAHLMAAVQIVPGLSPADTDEPLIVELVRRLDEPGPLDPFGPIGSPPNIGSPPDVGSPPDGVLGPGLRLPAATAREALDRIFTVWVTEVRPRLRPDLTDPTVGVGDASSEAGILLARIDVRPETPFQIGSPRLLDLGEPDDEGRPFLLHTQLIQELLFLGGGGGVEVLPQPEREFATLTTRGGRSLLFWVHHPERIELPPNPAVGLDLVIDGAPRPVTAATRLAVAGVQNLFELAVADIIPLRAVVELRVRLDEVTLTNGEALLSVVDRLGYGYVGREGETIAIYAAGGRPSPAREVVTISTVSAQREVALWFHSDDTVRLPATIRVERPTLGTTSDFATTAQGGGPFAAVWRARPVAGQPALVDDELLAFALDGAAIDVGGPAASTPLAAVLGSSPAAFVGFDGERTIRAFHDVDLPASPTPTPEPDFFPLPVLPFVTATLVNAEPVVELWFHLALDSFDDNRFIQEPVFQVLSEQGPPGMLLQPLPANIIDVPQHNVFHLFIDELGDQRASYLRFIFPIEENIVFDAGGGPDMTLGDYIRETRIKFEGHNGEKTIVAYLRFQR